VAGVEGQVTGEFNQQTSLIGGGNANSDSTSDADAVAGATGGSASSNSSGGSALGYSTSSLTFAPTSVSNYKARTSPIGAAPPYLPLWNHGGWGTVKGYFANGPSGEDAVYERTFDPADNEDLDELRGIMSGAPYVGPIELIGGVFNGVAAAFGAPDNFHHGRGFEIASSLVRQRRPSGKPLLVFIDSNVDRTLLKKGGYTYVGKVSVEAKETRNWDQAYDAAVIETMPWDVDVLLVSGGMKGVTVGSNLSFPSGSLGYSQMNYSLSLLGGTAKGVTEGKGKPVMSGEAYRYCPRLANKRRVPGLFYEKMKARYGSNQSQPMTPQLQPQTPQAQPSAPAYSTAPASSPKGIEVSQELYQMAGFQSQQVDMVTIR
jgi:hypothetical protein